MLLTLMNQFLVLGTALVVVLALVLIADRHQRLFLAMFMLLAALESTRDFAPALAIGFSDSSLYPGDILTVVCAIAVLKGMGRWRLPAATRAAILVFTALISLGVISWISVYGLRLGASNWRSQVLIVALLVYTTTRPRAWSWKDLRVIIVAPAIVVALASVTGILLHGLGSNTSVVEIGGVLEGGRPVDASGSLMILVALWVTALSGGKWGARRMLVMLLLGGTMILNQNRSVWVGAILGLVVWWLVPRIRIREASRALGGSSRTLVVSIAATATLLAAASVAVLGQSGSNSDTWVWRVSRWARSMDIPRSNLEWLVGSALGPTPASTPGLFRTTAHSFYVNAIEMTGFIGLTASLLIIIAVGRARVPPSIEPLGPVICLTFLSYGVAYQLDPWTWMVAGILLAATRANPAGEPRVMVHVTTHPDAPNPNHEENLRKTTSTPDRSISQEVVR